MKVNQDIAIVGQDIILVPYMRKHVLQYHEWMQDETLRQLTASEPLELEQEYRMQNSWRQDHDKLTFITCRPSDPGRNSPSQVLPSTCDEPSRMIGDVNMFLYSASAEDGHTDNELVGELELMVADPAARGCGYGKATLKAFLWFISNFKQDIEKHYGHSESNKPVNLTYLRARIHISNSVSIRLFNSLGFEISNNGVPNYFSEVELRRSIQDIVSEFSTGGPEIWKYSE